MELLHMLLEWVVRKWITVLEEKFRVKRKGKASRKDSGERMLPLKYNTIKVSNPSGVVSDL